MLPAGGTSEMAFMPLLYPYLKVQASHGSIALRPVAGKSAISLHRTRLSKSMRKPYLVPIFPDPGSSPHPTAHLSAT